MKQKQLQCGPNLDPNVLATIAIVYVGVRLALHYAPARPAVIAYLPSRFFASSVMTAAALVSALRVRFA